MKEIHKTVPINTRQKLPDRMSGLLAVCARDLESCVGDDRYHPWFSQWHESGVRGKTDCFVCAAGAVMAKTLGVNPSVDAVPSHFPRRIYEKLLAIDYIRRGEVRSAFRELGVRITNFKKVEGLNSLFERINELGHFDGDDEAMLFVGALRDAAAALDKIGL